MASDRIYVRGFPSDFSAEELKERFKEFGQVRKSYLKTSEDGRVFGFVRYLSSASANRALSLNGVKEGDIEWTVALAVDKNQRARQLIAEYDALCSARNGRNLVITNLPEATNENDLRELFGSFGTINSTAVIKRNDKIYGFAEFETIESASQATEAMKGYILNGNKLHVQKHVPKYVLGPHIQSIKQIRSMKKAGHRYGRHYVHHLMSNPASEAPVPAYAIRGRYPYHMRGRR